MSKLSSIILFAYRHRLRDIRSSPESLDVGGRRRRPPRTGTPLQKALARSHRVEMSRPERSQSKDRLVSTKPGQKIIGSLRQRPGEEGQGDDQVDDQGQGFQHRDVHRVLLHVRASGSLEDDAATEPGRQDGRR